MLRVPTANSRLVPVYNGDLDVWVLESDDSSGWATLVEMQVSGLCMQRKQPLKMRSGCVTWRVPVKGGCKDGERTEAIEAIAYSFFFWWY